MASNYIIALAFILGFALGRAATCTVAATGRWVNQGKMDWLFGLLVIASWAAIVLVVLVEWTGQAHLPLDIPLSGKMFVGAVLMGLGAIVNRGCFVGSVGQIGTGKFAYLLTFVGLGLALSLTGKFGLDLLGPTEFLPRTTIEQSRAKQIALAIFAMIAMVSLWLVLVRRNKAFLALVVIGICAATIYGTRPEWAYTAQLNGFLQGQSLSVGKTVELAVIALFAGAILSNWLKDRFRPEWGGWKLALANLAGGFLMGIGATAVPGGNDVLLMWTIPGLTLYGLVAYLTMIATIAAVMLVGRIFNRPISPPS
ncbi:YeeE/YedE thiosulfate transporter family protein [uncultured Parasphingorhabdus sp.]|uniref:YeeE/YedE thiosulfate transporter family protein n=1 Tax=uncultured Parasphingorhabdus sp. TaxID=2709694 RepID=UPI0030D960D3